MARITTRIETYRGKTVLVPARARDAEVLQDIRNKGPLQTVVLKYSRNDALRNWYWGLVQEVADGNGIHKDDLHAQLRFKVGLIKAWILGTTGPVAILKSTAKPENGGHLNDLEYRRYVDDAVEVIFLHYADPKDKPSLFKMVEERVGPRPK